MSQSTQNRSLQLAHSARHAVLAIVVLLHVVGLWLVAADFLIETRFGLRLLNWLTGFTGYTPMIEHTLKGVMGFWPVHSAAYGGILLTALVLYAMTQVLFLGAWPGMEARLQHPAPLTRLNTLGVSFAIGLLVLTWGTLAFELIAPESWVAWQIIVIDGDGSAGSARGMLTARQATFLGDWTGVYFFVPAGWVSMALLLGGWAIGPLVVRLYQRVTERFWHQRDRFSMMVGLLFWLFVLAGITLLISGLVQSRRYQFNALVPGTASYTSLIASLGLLMWTLFPLAKLLSLFQTHTWRREGRCLTCGYDLRASKREEGAACPECGAAMSA